METMRHTQPAHAEVHPLALAAISDHLSTDIEQCKALESSQTHVSIRQGGALVGALLGAVDLCELDQNTHTKEAKGGLGTRNTTGFHIYESLPLAMTPDDTGDTVNGVDLDAHVALVSQIYPLYRVVGWYVVTYGSMDRSSEKVNQSGIVATCIPGSITEFMSEETVVSVHRQFSKHIRGQGEQRDRMDVESASEETVGEESNMVVLHFNVNALERKYYSSAATDGKGGYAGEGNKENNETLKKECKDEFLLSIPASNASSLNVDIDSQPVTVYQVPLIKQDGEGLGRFERVSYKYNTWQAEYLAFNELKRASELDEDDENNNGNSSSSGHTKEEEEFLNEREKNHRNSIAAGYNSDQNMIASDVYNRKKLGGSSSNNLQTGKQVSSSTSSLNFFSKNQEDDMNAPARRLSRLTINNPSGAGSNNNGIQVSKITPTGQVKSFYLDPHSLDSGNVCSMISPLSNHGVVFSDDLLGSTIQAEGVELTPSPSVTSLAQDRFNMTRGGSHDSNTSNNSSNNNFDIQPSTSFRTNLKPIIQSQLSSELDDSLIGEATADGNTPSGGEGNGSTNLMANKEGKGKNVALLTSDDNQRNTLDENSIRPFNRLMRKRSASSSPRSSRGEKHSGGELHRDTSRDSNTNPKPEVITSTYGKDLSSTKPTTKIFQSMIDSSNNNDDTCTVSSMDTLDHCETPTVMDSDKHFFPIVSTDSFNVDNGVDSSSAANMTPSMSSRGNGSLLQSFGAYGEKMKMKAFNILKKTAITNVAQRLSQERQQQREQNQIEDDLGVKYEQQQGEEENNIIPQESTSSNVDINLRTPQSSHMLNTHNMAPSPQSPQSPNHMSQQRSTAVERGHTATMDTDTEDEFSTSKPRDRGGVAIQCSSRASMAASNFSYTGSMEDNMSLAVESVASLEDLTGGGSSSMIRKGRRDPPPTQGRRMFRENFDMHSEFTEGSDRGVRVSNVDQERVEELRMYYEHKLDVLYRTLELAEQRARDQCTRRETEFVGSMYRLQMRVKVLRGFLEADLPCSPAILGRIESLLGKLNVSQVREPGTTLGSGCLSSVADAALGARIVNMQEAAHLAHLALGS